MFLRDFPGSPVVKTSWFHYRGHRFNPWSGNWDPAYCTVQPRLKKKKKVSESELFIDVSWSDAFLSRSRLREQMLFSVILKVTTKVQDIWSHTRPWAKLCTWSAVPSFIHRRTCEMGPASSCRCTDGETDPWMGYLGYSYSDGRKVVGWAGLWPPQLWSPHSWPLYTKFYLHVGPWVQNANRAEPFSQRSLQGILTATGVAGLWCLNISVISYSCCSVAKSCLTLCNVMSCSTPSLPVLHHLLERLGCFNSL